MAEDPTANLQTDYALDFVNAAADDDDDDEREDPTGRNLGSNKHVSNQEMFLPFLMRPTHRVVRGGNQSPEDHVLTTPGEASITPREQKLPRLK